MDPPKDIRDQNAASAHAFLQFKPKKTYRQPEVGRISLREDQRRNSLPDSPFESGLHSPLKPGFVMNSMPKLSQASSEGVVCEKMFMEPAGEDDNTMLNLNIVERHFLNTRADSTKSGHGYVPRYTFYSEKTGVVRSAHFESLDIKNCGHKVSEILNDTFWMDIICPSPKEVYDVSQVFGLHPLTTEDIQTPDTREKCEVFSKYVFLVIKSFEKDQFQPKFLEPITFFICLFENCVISVLRFN